MSEILQYGTGILMSAAGLLYCCENIRDDCKKPQIWLAFAGMLAGTMLVAYFYEQPGNFIAYSITLIFLILAVYTDIKSGIIPDMLIIIFLVAGIFTVPVNPSITWQESAIGFFAAGLLFGLLSFISKGAMGMGDAKLLSVTAMIIGWKMFLTVILIAIVFSVIAGVFLLLLKLKKRNDRIPFSPFLLAGVLICVLL